MNTGLHGRLGRFITCAVTGLGLGLLVGGVVGRVAMFLLARSSPEAHGIPTDDGFAMGRFTVGGTLQLMATAAVLGLIGAGVYASVRWLHFPGPAVRVVTTAICAGVGVGALLVHRDGVDFTLLDAPLAIALFVAIPALYGGLLAWVLEARVPTRQAGRSSRSFVLARWGGRAVAASAFLLLLRDLVLDTVALT
ncbi:MAG TPA: hypothetical protein VGK78_04415 [Nocardioides sp.]|uniref:hypothetical protein n=1 Tax=Nocardioides sp. TaxID=35761 RepID=UPI002F40517C